MRWSDAIYYTDKQTSAQTEGGALFEKLSFQLAVSKCSVIHH